MELAFFTPLLKDSANSVSGGVAIKDEGVLKTRLVQNRGHTDCVDKSLKGGFMFGFPMETAASCAVSNESVEWCSDHAEITNVHPIEVEET